MSLEAGSSGRQMPIDICVTDTMCMPNIMLCLPYTCIICTQHTMKTRTHAQPKKLAKPPLPTSVRLADEVMGYIRANPGGKLFPKYNEPQLTAIRSALTRRLTLIQGPPGKW